MFTISPQAKIEQSQRYHPHVIIKANHQKQEVEYQDGILVVVLTKSWKTTKRNLEIVVTQNGDFENALRNYLLRHQIAIFLNENSFENIVYKNALAVSNQKLADIYSKIGNKKKQKSIMSNFIE